MFYNTNTEIAKTSPGCDLFSANVLVFWQIVSFVENRVMQSTNQCSTNFTRTEILRTSLHFTSHRVRQLRRMQVYATSNDILETKNNTQYIAGISEQIIRFS